MQMQAESSSIKYNDQDSSFLGWQLCKVYMPALSDQPSFDYTLHLLKIHVGVGIEAD